MKLRFTGAYTNGRESITYLGCTFTGHEPREVPANVAELLANHPEFEWVHALDHDANGAKGGSLPKVRRVRKVKF